MPTFDLEIIVQGCNLGACTLFPSSSSSSSSSSFSPSFYVPFCGMGSEGGEGVVEEVVEGVEKKIAEGKLNEVLGVLVAVGGVEGCGDVEVIIYLFIM